MKINFFKKYYQKCYYYHKNFEIPFVRTMMERQRRQSNDCFYDFFSDCEEALTFFKFENVY